jgi:hypothetical protein
MPDYLRSLAVVMVLATATFALIGRCSPALMPVRDFKRRRNLWLVVTLVAFLAHNFWLYSVVVGLIGYFGVKKETNPLALYFLLLFAVPAISNDVPGFGVINYFFTLDYLRLLSLAVLAPVALKLHQDRDSLPIGKSLPDKMLLAYVGYNLYLMFFAGSFTNFLRVSFTNTLDILLPYYVASRSLRNLQSFREALACFVFGTLIQAAVGGFESAKGWLIYGPLADTLGGNWGGTHYLMRGESLRALGSAGQAIPYGYIMAVALGCWLYLQPLVTGRMLRTFMWSLLVAGLIASFSRGPWLGAVLLTPIFALGGPRAGRRLITMAIVMAVGVGLIYLLPQGKAITDLLPFDGGTDYETVTYRQQLLEILVPIVLDNPLFGASSFLYSSAAEALKQGEGIIDLVNSYLSVALYSGLPGLGFFVGVFIFAISGMVKAMRKMTDKDNETHHLGQALVAVVLCILVIIFTVSSISVIAYIYWAFAGIAVAYVGLQNSSPKSPPESAKSPSRGAINTGDIASPVPPWQRGARARGSLPLSKSHAS